MRASILIIILCAGSSFPAVAQNVNHHIVAPAGDIDRNDRIELAWTIGEVAVNSRINQQESFTEGFHQPVLRVEPVTTDSDPAPSSHTVSVFPNPVQQQLHLRFESPVTTTWHITLTSTDGAVLSQYEHVKGNADASLDVTALPAGLYLLHLRSTDEKQLLQYKISKIQ